MTFLTYIYPLHHKGTDGLVTPDKDAVMLTVPGYWPVAKPLGAIVNVFSLLELQVTLEVMSAVVPLEYVPIAVNCCVILITTGSGFAGVIAIEDSVSFVVDLDADSEEHPVVTVTSVNAKTKAKP